MTWFMRDPFFDPIYDFDPFSMTDYLDRRLNQMLAPSTQSNRMIEGQQNQQGQGGQGGQVQQAGQQAGQMDRFRNSLLAGRGFKVDVSETPQSYIVRADLPGVDKKDIKVEITDNEDYLTIQAEKKEEKREDNESRHIVERSYGSFTRTFRLPENVNVSDCKTQFNNGVLELTFNKKAEEKKEPKRIAIQ